MVDRFKLDWDVRGQRLMDNERNWEKNKKINFNIQSGLFQEEIILCNYFGF